MPFESLAPTNRLSKMGIPSLLLMLFVAAIYYASTVTVISNTILIIAAVAILILLILVIKGYQNYDIYYNDHVMQLRGSKARIDIPYAAITSFTMTANAARILGMSFYEYRVEYNDEDNRTCEISFWAPINSRGVDEFENNIKHKRN